MTRAVQAAEEADLRLWVLDASEPLLPEDRELGVKLQSAGHLLVVRNKSDLPACWNEDALQGTLGISVPVLTLSALQEKGIDALKEKIWNMAVGEDSLEDAIHASVRQCQELRQAEAAAAKALEALERGHGEDVLALELQETLQAVERLLGLQWNESLLDEIFSRFCVGK